MESKGDMMEAANQYVKIMIDSLRKKIAVLDQIMDSSKQLSTLVAEPEMDMELFREKLDEEGEYAEQINQLDEGFQTLFDKVKEELEADKPKYKAEIQEMQRLIREIADRTVQIEELEAKNRLAVEGQFRKMRMDIRNAKQGMQVAQNYYKSMSKLNVIDSQFTDQRK